MCLAVVLSQLREHTSLPSPAFHGEDHSNLCLFVTMFDFQVNRRQPE
jgi:hypothetical protein